jgi:queuine tRNA-ribosyltransferase
LHYYLQLMREMRAAIDDDRFQAFTVQFKAERARGT